MTIHHIVLLKFKPDITSADADKVRSILLALPSQIPSISDFQAGKKIKHRRDHDYDEGFTFIFKDEEALKDYYSSQSAFRESIHPYLEDKLIFDIDVGE